MPASTKLPLRLICRITNLLAFGVAAVLYVKAWPIAFDAYNAVCPPEDRVFTPLNRALFQSELIHDTMIAVGVFALPALLARSRIAVGANLVAAVLILLFALGLSHSATTPPNECARNAGTYEDHASGLWDFEMFAGLLLLPLYGIAVVDIAIWFVPPSRAALKRVFGKAGALRAEPDVTTPSVTPPTG